METLYSVGGLKIDTDGERYFVLNGTEKLDSFNDYQDAGKLLSDLRLSKMASDDSLVGTKRFCDAMFGNGHEVIVVAKIDDGYLVQLAGTNDRMEIAEESLEDVPDLFGDDK